MKECITHHACDCIQKELNELNALVNNLRHALEDFIESRADNRKERDLFFTKVPQELDPGDG